MPPCHHEPGKSFWARIREDLSQLGMRKSAGPGRMHQGVLRGPANIFLKSPGDSRRSLIPGKRQTSQPSSGRARRMLQGTMGCCVTSIPGKVMENILLEAMS